VVFVGDHPVIDCEKIAVDAITQILNNKINCLILQKI